jgi:hypothetical protein
MGTFLSVMIMSLMLCLSLIGCGNEAPTAKEPTTKWVLQERSRYFKGDPYTASYPDNSKQTYKYVYDSFGRVTVEYYTFDIWNPNIGKYDNGYSAIGYQNITKINTYDAFGRLIQVDTSTLGDPYFTNTSNTSTEVHLSTTTYNHNNNSDITSEVTISPDGMPYQDTSYTSEYTYDKIGKILSAVRRDLSTSSEHSTGSYITTTNDYNADGSISSRRECSFSPSGTLKSEESTIYANGKVTEIKHIVYLQNGKTLNSVTTKTYSYNSSDSITSIVTTNKSGITTDKYNPITGQIISSNVHNPSGLGYIKTYDVYGHPSITSIFSDDPSSPFIPKGDYITNYNYDQNGNLATVVDNEGTEFYVWVKQ